jgi:glycogen debranching enzyme
VNIHLPRQICGDAAAALGREWLVTNGLGGFAAGTVAGALTRRYHGLLFAATRPPGERRLLVAKLDETVTLSGRSFPLSANVWVGHVDAPNLAHLDRFDLELGIPTWTFDLDGARLLKRVWMEPGHNVTYVQYELDASSPPIELCARLLVNDRFYHHLHRGGELPIAGRIDGSTLDFDAPHSGLPMRATCVTASPATWTLEHTWWWGFHLPVEAARGFDRCEDHLALASCRVGLTPGRSVTFVLAAGAFVHTAQTRTYPRTPLPFGETQGEGQGRPGISTLPRPLPGREGGDGIASNSLCSMRLDHARALLDTWRRHAGPAAEQTPPGVQQLVLAADQFVVVRPHAAAAPEEPRAGGPCSPSSLDHTIIAGYPWFTDWGRDTMISLPGLTLVTGRFEIAREILLTWARYVRDGLIPNRFPDAGAEPEYHTADATLWYLWAIDQYVRFTADVPTLAALFPVIEEIIAAHRRGTRHNIQVADDGLLHAGEPGMNLTWMDAKIGERVVTPRMGKPVELSALWYDALCNVARLAELVERPNAEYVKLAERTRASFDRFWNRRRRCCYDVLDGPAGNDASLRPNQIFAVSLTHSPLPRERQAAVVRACEKHLLTWFGLRSLAPAAAGYRGRYAGGPVERDEAYHQGTAWGWLLGPFVIADFHLHRDAQRARRFLNPMVGHLWSAGIGSAGELFDGDEPHTPNGCPAQAWSVAETLRAWWVTQANSRCAAGG